MNTLSAQVFSIAFILYFTVFVVGAYLLSEYMNIPSSQVFSIVAIVG